MKIEAEPKSENIFLIKKDTLAEWEKEGTLDMTFPQTREQIITQFHNDPSFARALSSIIGLQLYNEYTTPKGLIYITPTISEQAISELPYGTLAFLEGVGNALRLMSINLKNENYQVHIRPDIETTLEEGSCELNSIANSLGIKQEKWHTIEMAIRATIKATPNLGTNMDILDIKLRRILIDKGYQLTDEEIEEISKFFRARNKILQRIDEPEYSQDLLRVQGYQQDEETKSQRLRYKDPYFVKAMEKSLKGKGPVIDINTMAGWIAVHEMYSS